MSERAPRVSIVVPLYDRSAYTRVFLLALREVLPGEPPAEVVFVDNGSTDDTATVLAELGAEHRVVSLDRNHDFAGGCNRGAAASTGDLLLFLNNDMVPTRGFLSAALRAIDGDPGVGVVGSRLLFPDGRIQHAGIAFDSTTRPHHLHQLLPGDHPVANVARELQAVTGAALLLRRADFESLGGFDEAFRNSFEDVDLCLRLRERGRRVVYCPTSVLYHFTSASAGRHDWDEENFQRLHARWHGRVEADFERLSAEAGAERPSAATIPSMTPDARALLADARRDSLAWRTSLHAVETRLQAVLASATPGPEPRVLWLDCPHRLPASGGVTARAYVTPGARGDGPLLLTCRWSGEGTLPRPRTVELAPPLGSVVETVVPVDAPSSPGSYLLHVCLIPREGTGAPAWTKSIQVLPLYGADYSAEVPPRLLAGEAVVIPVRLANAGLVPWEGAAFRLSYHWRSLDGANPGIQDGWRIYIDRPVLPGESTFIRARVLAPPGPGRYALEWDMVYEGIAWFSERGVPVSSHAVDVVGA